MRRSSTNLFECYKFVLSPWLFVWSVKGGWTGGVNVIEDFIFPNLFSFNTNYTRLLWGKTPCTAILLLHGQVHVWYQKGILTINLQYWVINSNSFKSRKWLKHGYTAFILTRLTGCRKGVRASKRTVAKLGSGMLKTGRHIAYEMKPIFT